MMITIQRLWNFIVMRTQMHRSAESMTPNKKHVQKTKPEKELLKELAQRGPRNPVEAALYEKYIRNRG